MCGRFALTAPASDIAEIFQVDVLPDILPRYNVAPTTQVACVVEEDDGQRSMQTFRWGLIPRWAKDKKIAYRTINARSETVASKPAFRAAFKRRRLLILADGFYEWHRVGTGKAQKKTPHLIQLADGRPFAMAGLWETWVDPETEEELRSCTIVTTEGNDLMKPIHDRMPVILPADRWDLWLDRSVDDKSVLQELLVPYPADDMKERRVSKSVGNVRNKGPEVQGPFEEDDD
ncbi:MAG: SOS response-associated peptidase [Myxococcales bacterium]|nr:SOS response-associated peptidase [Myxococcales bacterium]